MLRVTGTAIVFAVSLMSTSVSAQEAAPTITGTWTGTYTGGVRGGGGQLQQTSNPPAFVEPGQATYKLEIKEQNGRGFTGTWGAELGFETMQGVIRLDNRTLLIVDDDSSLTGTLLSDTEMELCGHWLSLTDRFTLCFLLTKE